MKVLSGREVIGRDWWYLLLPNKSVSPFDCFDIHIDDTKQVKPMTNYSLPKRYPWNDFGNYKLRNDIWHTNILILVDKPKKMPMFRVHSN